MYRAATIGLILGIGALLMTPPLLAQSPPGAPTLPGQDAFGAIAEVVRLLEGVRDAEAPRYERSLMANRVG